MALPLAFVPGAPETVEVASQLFGCTLVVPASACITTTDGLYGFPGCREWVLLDAKRPGFFWLHSRDERALAFLLVDPFQAFPDYAVTLSRRDRAALQVQRESDVAILAIVTLPSPPSGLPTANLQGPLAVNLRAGLARQIAVGDSAWGTRTAFVVSGANPAA